MAAMQKRRDVDALQPADVRLQEAAIAILIERIAGLEKERKEDLAAIIMDLKSCTKEELAETEQTIREMIFPQLSGNLIRGHAGNAGEKDKLDNWVKGVGERIKVLRQKKRMTQEELAKSSGLPQSHISRLESGQHSPSHKTVSAIAQALGVPVTDIDPGSD